MMNGWPELWSGLIPMITVGAVDNAGYRRPAVQAIRRHLILPLVSMYGHRVGRFFVMLDEVQQ